jgi:hypothetical protein
MLECCSTIWNSIEEVLCATKIEKLEIHVKLEAENMHKKGLLKKKPTSFSKKIKTKYWSKIWKEKSSIKPERVGSWKNDSHS